MKDIEQMAIILIGQQNIRIANAMGFLLDFA